MLRGVLSHFSNLNRFPVAQRDAPVISIIKPWSDMIERHNTTNHPTNTESRNTKLYGLFCYNVNVNVNLCHKLMTFCVLNGTRVIAMSKLQEPLESNKHLISL